jgi:uncharacterized membrane protein
MLAAIILIILDFIYISFIKTVFTNQIQKIQGSKVTINWVGIILCYVFIIASLHYFILWPKKSVLDAFILGFLTYGIYETTNYALFKDWSFNIVVLDTLWGGILFALTTYIYGAISSSKYMNKLW